MLNFVRNAKNQDRENKEEKIDRGVRLCKDRVYLCLCRGIETSNNLIAVFGQFEGSLRWEKNSGNLYMRDMCPVCLE